jgi:hypothetical protein
MKAGSPVMKRCQATAQHGRRCMQTPYVTSPFCWHHTARADREALRLQGLRNDDSTKVSVERIVSVLGDTKVAELVDFLEAEGADAVRIERSGGEIIARAE